MSSLRHNMFGPISTSNATSGLNAVHNPLDRLWEIRPETCAQAGENLPSEPRRAPPVPALQMLAHLVRDTFDPEAKGVEPVLPTTGFLPARSRTETAEAQLGRLPDGIEDLVDKVELVLGADQGARGDQREVQVLAEGAEGPQGPGLGQPEDLVQESAQLLELTDEIQGRYGGRRTGAHALHGASLVARRGHRADSPCPVKSPTDPRRGERELRGPHAERPGPGRG